MTEDEFRLSVARSLAVMANAWERLAAAAEHVADLKPRASAPETPFGVERLTHVSQQQRAAWDREDAAQRDRRL